MKHKTGEIREEVGEKNEYPSIWTYIWGASSNGSSYGATTAQLKSLANAQTLFKQMNSKLQSIGAAISPFELQLNNIGAPGIRD